MATGTTTPNLTNPTNPARKVNTDHSEDIAEEAVVKDVEV